MRQVHLFNGMENYTTNNDPATGTTSLGIADAPLMVVQKDGAKISPFKLDSCYLDNSYIDVYDDAGLRIVNCEVTANNLHMHPDITHLINNYAREPNAPSRIVIEGVMPQITGQNIRLLRYLTNAATGDTWQINASVFEASAANLLDSRNVTNSVAARFDRFASEENAETIHGPNAKVMTRYRAQTGTGFMRIGVNGDQAVVETPNGSMRVEKPDGTVHFKADEGGLLVTGLAANPTAPVLGDIFTHTGEKAIKAWLDGAWVSLDGVIAEQVDVPGYRKWSSGRLECWGTATSDTTATPSTINFALPPATTFLNTNYRLIPATQGLESRTHGIGGKTTTSFTYQAYVADTGALSAANMEYFVIGRWK